MNLLRIILNTAESKCANNFNFSRKKSCNLEMSWGLRPSVIFNVHVRMIVMSQSLKLESGDGVFTAVYGTAKRE
eukprot:5151660-Pleurochrysis_carterae.AAC.1